MAGVPFRTLGRIARLPGVAYSERYAFMLMTASPAGHQAAVRPGQVLTLALVDNPAQARTIIVAGRRPSPSRADEVMINETAARILRAHVGSVVQLRGFRPGQVMPVLNNEVLRPAVTLPDVRVTAIIRTPTDLSDSGAPSDVTFTGTGTLYLTAAFYHRFAGSVGNIVGLAFHLHRGLPGLPAFRAAVNRLAGGRAQIELGSDDASAATAAERGTSLQALALLLFGIIVALAMVVIVGQSVARLALTAAEDFPVLRALGCSRAQLVAVALAPGALVAAAGMALAIPAAYAMSVFTPIGLARRAEISPGFSLDAPVLLGGAVLLTLLGDGDIGGQDVPVVGIRPLRGRVAPPLLDGRLPRGPREIALSGGELRALHTGVGGLVRARTTRGMAALRITGQIVLSPEITNEQVRLGAGGVMTLTGAQALSRTPLPVNVYLVRLRHPGDPAEIARLKRQFPGVVLPAVPPPEVRELQGVNGLPLVLACALTLLAAGTIAHTLVTSVRRRRRDLAILKAIGFVSWQVRATVAWQATAIAATGLVIGLPLGVAAGRWAWTLLARGFAIEPVPVISALVLLSVPAVLLMANLVAAVPGRAAARTQPAVVLRAE